MSADPPLLALEQYVAVHAALAEGFALEDVLAHESLSLEAWALADRDWAKRMLKSTEGDMALVEAYDRLMIQRQEAFRRRITPLDEDLAAWLDFLHHFTQADDPPALLAELGLVQGDVMRLQRSWTLRTADEEELRQRYIELMQAARGAMPTLDIEPLRMPPPVGGGLRRPVDGPPPDAPAPEETQAPAPLPPLLVPLPEATSEDEAVEVLEIPAQGPEGEGGRPMFSTGMWTVRPDTPALPFRQAPGEAPKPKPAPDSSVLPFQKGYAPPPPDDDD